MTTRNVLTSARVAAAALFGSLFLAACGGGGSDSSLDPVDTQTTQPSTGTVGLLFTDLPTDAYDSIILKFSAATLIGDDDSQQVLFEDEQREIDLLKLTNYSEPVWFGEVLAGTYTKIRLQLDDIVLVPDGGGPDSAFSIGRLPANGKVDLLHPDGFEVLPGRNLMIEIDVDANKAFKITEAGNSGNINFRPVVRVNVEPQKLARIEGAVTGEPSKDNGNGTFVVCSIDVPDHCVDVATTDDETSFFDDLGLESDFGALADGSMVVVIGEYGGDPIVLNAVVVEIGGTATQFTGNVATEPDGSQFLILTVQGEDYIVELQETTKYYDESGPISLELIAFGDRVEVEGVVVTPDEGPETTDAQESIRAALVFLEAYDEQLSGTIVDGTIQPDSRSFDVVTDALDTVCVRVAAEDEVSILLVDAENSIVTPGGFGDLVADLYVDLFGTTAQDACFEADEVIVDVSLAE